MIMIECPDVFGTGVKVTFAHDSIYDGPIENYENSDNYKVTNHG